MVTKDELLEVACQAEAIMNAEKADHQPGTMLNTRWRDAYLVHNQAIAAAQWLEEAGLTAIEQIGPFGEKPIKKGDTVIIKRGAVILSMNPKYTRENPKIARRDYKVVVHDVHSGYISSHWHPHKHDSVETHREQNICWPGDGGYWCYLDTKDVEIIS